MKTKELRSQHEGELEKTLQERYNHLRKLRFKKMRKEIKDTSEEGKTKKDIARILTIRHELQQTKKP